LYKCNPDVTYYSPGREIQVLLQHREEMRKHVHVATADGTAKIWLEPVIALTDFYNLDTHELTEIIQIIEEHKNEFIEKWDHHFGL
jgi:Domain of unknown function (DUF4160)